MEGAVKLEMIYLPVSDIGPALALYRDTLGFDEVWREGDSTVGLKVPDSEVVLMLDRDPYGRPGPMFTTDLVTDFLDRHGDAIDVVAGPMEIPGGYLVGFQDPGGNTVYVLDQSTEDAATS